MKKQQKLTKKQEKSQPRKQPMMYSDALRLIDEQLLSLNLITREQLMKDHLIAPDNTLRVRFLKHFKGHPPK